MTRFASARLLPALAICGLAVVLTGCEISIGGDDKTVEQSSEVSQARKTLSKLPDLPPAKSVDCPSAVDAKTDTTYECSATLDNGQEVVLPARVDSVGDHRRVGLVSNLDVVQQALAVDLIYKIANSTPKTVDCPSDTPASVSKTFDCEVTFPGGSADTVTLKVTTTTPRQNLTIDHVGKG